jgi:hypothetical protein
MACRHRFLGLLVMPLGLVACAGANMKGASAPASGGAMMEAPPMAPGEARSSDSAAPMAAPAPAPAMAGVAVNSTSSANAGTPAAAVAAPEREMLDIEAHLTLLVANVSVARARLHERAAELHATITSDVLRDDGSPRELSLTIRVPSAASDAFVNDLERVGQVTARQIIAKDVGREYHDSEIVLHNLERTLARYEEILQKASTVEEMLRIEAELSRIRGEIDRVKGELRYLGDRVSRATVYLVIHERTQEIVEQVPEEAKFYPGLRAVSLTELGGERSSVSAWGGGVAVGAGRTGNVELDALHRNGSRSHGPDVVLLTAGGDVYSDFLGGGRRRFLNPYLGLRVGYGRVAGANDFVCAGTIGVELFKSRYATIDTDVRVLGLFGKPGSELGIEPTLGANVAF